MFELHWPKALVVLICMVWQSEPQAQVIPNNFGMPLRNPLVLSGNFAEPRKGHFHAGLDMRTLEREGLEVLAAGDGYVSRVNVSPFGYGNALYITHPNGYTTVYGHLASFNDAITKALRTEQYRKKSFSVDLFFKSGELPVKKGDVVALSGNTGGSGGPHLHFEVRDSAERPMNPMLFGFVPHDHIAPLVNAIKVYPMDGQNHFSTALRLPLSKKEGSIATTATAVKVNADKVGIALNTFDRMDQTAAAFGVYAIKLFDNGKLIYYYRTDRVSFADMRQVICQVDYPVFLKEGSRSFHRLFQLPGNRLDMYPVAVNHGFIDLSDSQPHVVELESSDFAGNVSKVKIILQRDVHSRVFKPNGVRMGKMLDCGNDNIFNTEEFGYAISAKALADTVFVNYKVTRDTNGVATYTIGENTTHLLDYATVKLLAAGIPNYLLNKVVVVWKDLNGSWVAKGGKSEGLFISAKVRELGAFSLRLDTVAPTLQPINFNPQKPYSANQRILFRTSDKLSGVATFNAFIDDNWRLMEMDAKTGRLSVLLENLSYGKHLLKITVSDERGNSNSYETDFLMN